MALLAVLLLGGACANPFVGTGKSPGLTAAKESPSPPASPSPVPSPTGPLAAAAPSFKVGEVNATYPTVAFNATGGLPPYQWTVYAGAPPPGLSLGTDGSVSGSPTAAGTFKFVAQVADSGTGTATASATMVIKPALVASLLPPCATSCNVEIGCVNVCGLFGTVNGGVPPYTYSVISGVVPAGTALANNAFNLTGYFRGGPGYLQFTAMVRDGLGQTFDLSPVFQIYPHLSFAGGTANCYYPGCGAPSTFPAVTFPYSGGVGAVSVQVSSWRVTCDVAGCSPGTPTASISGGTVTVNIPGSTGGSGYSAVLTLVLTDSSLCAANSHCSTSGTINVTVASG